MGERVGHTSADGRTPPLADNEEGDPIMPAISAEVTTGALQAFADAWNRHDADALMSFMTDDCVFEASAGTEVCGKRYAGYESVRAAFALGIVTIAALVPIVTTVYFVARQIAKAVQNWQGYLTNWQEFVERLPWLAAAEAAITVRSSGFLLNSCRV